VRRSGRATVTPKTGDGPVETLRLFKLAKDSAVKARTQAINQLKAVRVGADPDLREALAGLGRATLIRRCAQLPDPDTTASDTLAAAAVTAIGATLGCTEAFADAGGYRRLFQFAHHHLPDRRCWAIEGTSSYGAGLTGFLIGQGERVVEVCRPKRPPRRGARKSDALDAVRAAREVLSHRPAHPGTHKRSGRPRTRAAQRAHGGAVFDVAGAGDHGAWRRRVIWASLVRPRSSARRSSGAQTISDLRWLTAAVPAVTAPARVAATISSSRAAAVNEKPSASSSR
jgi:hypothetical protein